MRDLNKYWFHLTPRGDDLLVTARPNRRRSHRLVIKWPGGRGIRTAGSASWISWMQEQAEFLIKKGRPLL